MNYDDMIGNLNAVPFESAGDADETPEVNENGDSSYKGFYQRILNSKRKS